MSIADLATIISAIIGSTCSVLTYYLARESVQGVNGKSRKASTPDRNGNAQQEHNGTKKAALNEIEEIVLSIMEMRSNYQQKTIFMNLGAILGPLFLSLIVITIIQRYAGGPVLSMLIGPFLAAVAGMYFAFVVIPKWRDRKFGVLVDDKVKRMSVLAKDVSIDLKSVRILRNKLSKYPILYCADGVMLLDDVILAEFYSRASLQDRSAEPSHTR